MDVAWLTRLRVRALHHATSPAARLRTGVAGCSDFCSGAPVFPRRRGIVMPGNALTCLRAQAVNATPRPVLVMVS